MSIEHSCMDISIDRFTQHYALGKINPITLEEIPANAMNFFERYSERFIHPGKYKEKDFNSSFKIVLDNGYNTFIVSQIKRYDTSKTTEKLVYLFDSTPNNVNVGHGEIRYDFLSKDSFFRKKPFVGFNETEKDFRNNGLGTERLRIMNALSFMYFDLPLNSDTTITDTAKRCWEQLVENNEAIAYDHIIEYDKKRIVKKRFHFIK